MIAIGVVYTPQYARLIRGQVLAVKTTEYVLASQAIGASRLRITLSHILPNSFTPVLVMATLQAGSGVGGDPGRSFPGPGGPPPPPDWGAGPAEEAGCF